MKARAPFSSRNADSLKVLNSYRRVTRIMANKDYGYCCLGAGLERISTVTKFVTMVFLLT